MEVLLSKTPVSKSSALNAEVRPTPETPDKPKLDICPAAPPADPHSCASLDSQETSQHCVELDGHNQNVSEDKSRKPEKTSQPVRSTSDTDIHDSNIIDNTPTVNTQFEHPRRGETSAG